MNYQKMRIDFTQKRAQTTPFLFKTGEVDVDGIEAELVNIDVEGNPSGIVKITSPNSVVSEGIVRFENELAYFDIPKNEEGFYTFELTIFNKGNKTRSGNFEVEIIRSLNDQTEEYETLLDTITKKDAEFTTNENTRKTNENTRIANENARKSAETNRVASMTDIEKRFASLSTAQQQQAEVADARMDAAGTVHANLKTRLDEEFKELASKIPTDVAMNGYESVTTNDTLSGEVSSAVLSGQTLVNVARFPNTSKSVTVNAHNIIYNGLEGGTINFKPSTKYTLIVSSDKNVVDRFSISEVGTTGVETPLKTLETGNNVIFSNAVHTVITKSDVASNLRLYANSTEATTVTITTLILEGDHTNKPLEFFEGLKSAELSEVTTHGVNLVSEVIEGKYQNSDIAGGAFGISDNSNFCISNFVKVRPDFEYRSNFLDGAWYSDSKTPIKTVKYSSTKIAPRDAKYLVLTTNISNKSGRYIYEVTTNTPSTYVPYQSSKTTFTPIKLRSLPNGVVDTYDVDTGVLTRRCGEVVLNGSESWGINTASEKYARFYFNTTLAPSSLCRSDKFPEAWATDSQEGCSTGSNTMMISITKSKLPTPDVAGFKAWLTANPTKVVYQLATPTTEYIENNGQLRSYDSQTTVFANSIVPVKISGNIPVNYASTLANLALQARNLRIENTALIEQAESLSEQLNIAEQTNDFQDELIDVSLMATDELYVMLEPLLAQTMMSSKQTQNVSDETTTDTQDSSPESTTNTQDSSQDTTKNTQGGNAMVDAYVAMVIRGLKTIDEVPARYREEVRRILAELDK